MQNMSLMVHRQFFNLVSSDDISQLVAVFEVLVELPVFDDEFEMIPASDVVGDVVSVHVGVAHDSDKHVQKMNDHHESTHYEEEYEEIGRLAVSQPESVVVEFS